MTGTFWKPDQYMMFGDHRLRPAMDLLGRVPLSDPHVIYDLGCGTGNVTRNISERWPSAAVTGIDHSAQMLDQARHQAGTPVWLEADIRDWVPDHPPDLIYTNAALHWVPDHDILFPRLAAYIKPGGCLAVQMPLSFNLPSHRIMRETLAGGKLSGKAYGSRALRDRMSQKPVADAAHYYDILSRCSEQVDVWETEYLHVLQGEDAVLEWVKGTGLRPVLHDLEDAEREAFLDVYGERLRDAYPTRPDGQVLYPFRRLFLVAQF